MIGLLTGTFDPVHQGHVAMARAALEAAGLDEVWFMVNPDPVHKLARVSYADRVAMVERALDGQTGLRLAPLDETQAARPHTVGTFLQLLVELRPQVAEFVVGLDAIANLDTWDDVESVVKHTSYVVVHRPGTSLAGLAALRERLGSLGKQLRVRVVDSPNLLEVSSTQLRQQLAAGRASEALVPGVLDYIRRQQLYQSL